MTGMSRQTGRLLGFDAHLAQSIEDILTTPIGSRVMRRAYGSQLPRLIDAPITPETVIDLYAATAEAIDRWEPRLRLKRVEVADPAPGRLTLLLSGEVRGRPAALSVGVVS